MRKRICDYKAAPLKPGDQYEGSVVKSTRRVSGVQVPTRALYDNGELVGSQDEILRVVLVNGMIHYVKL
jgi:hypothetical protein